MTPKLSPKHARFVSEYLLDLNASAAYKRAGYAPKNADVNGPRLMGNAGIAAAIAAGRTKQLAANELSAHRVLEELRRVGLANMRDYFDEHGDAKHPGQLTVEQGAGLGGWEVLIKNAKAGDGVTDTIHKVKLGDKVKALELLGKHFKLFVDRVEVTGAEGRVARLEAARARTAAHE